MLFSPDPYITTREPLHVPRLCIIYTALSEGRFKAANNDAYEEHFPVGGNQSACRNSGLPVIAAKHIDPSRVL